MCAEEMGTESKRQNSQVLLATATATLAALAASLAAAAIECKTTWHSVSKEERNKPSRMRKDTVSYVTATFFGSAKTPYTDAYKMLGLILATSSHL